MLFEALQINLYLQDRGLFVIKKVGKSLIITSIIKQKSNSERYNIYIDEEYKFSIDIDLLYELKLEENMTIDIEQLQEAIKRADTKKAFNMCIAILARASKTEYEIKKKLLEKKYSEEVINEIIHKLKQLDYINDDKYIDAWIRSKSGAATLNKKIIYNKLIQKGIDRSLIQEKIENNAVGDGAIDEYSSAYKLAEKKYKSFKGNNEEIRNKLLTFLYNKGFEKDICYRVVRDIITGE